MFVLMNTKRPKQMVSVTLDPALVEQLKAWISEQKIRPSQSAVVSTALEEFLGRNTPLKESSANGG